MPPKLAIGHTDSAGETVQRLLPNAKVIKTLNIVGNPYMIHPDFTCGPPTMFICGDDEKAKKMVIETILTPFGWETIDIGGIVGGLPNLLQCFGYYIILERIMEIMRLNC